MKIISLLAFVAGIIAMGCGIVAHPMQGWPVIVGGVVTILGTLGLRHFQNPQHNAQAGFFLIAAIVLILVAFGLR